MNKYTKKQIEIEALQWNGKNFEEVKNFCSDVKLSPDGNKIVIKTLEGAMLGSIGDYIIKGVEGEFYPCKPKVFELTYSRTPVTHTDRMIKEHQDLKDKILKLTTFVQSEKFKSLDPLHQSLLYAQNNAMQTYFAILNTRLFIED